MPCHTYAAAIDFSFRVIRLLYRAAVFFLIIPHLADRSISENVCGTAELAPLASFCSSSRRIARTWCRSRVLRNRLISVRRFSVRTRFREDTVLAIR